MKKYENLRLLWAKWKIIIQSKEFNQKFLFVNVRCHVLEAKEERDCPACNNPLVGVRLTVGTNVHSRTAE